jgi:hypothetical protein
MRQPPVMSFKRIVAGTVVIGTVGTIGAAGTGASRPRVPPISSAAHAGRRLVFRPKNDYLPA